MQLTVPPDLEALVERRLAIGGSDSVEDLFRRAFETLEAEETASEEERRALDAKIHRAKEQAAAGHVYGPDEARRKLDEFRSAHLANRS